MWGRGFFGRAVTPGWVRIVSVGMERFIDTLKKIGFKGQLNIEREVPDHAERLRDIAMGVKLLEKLRG